jgi:ribonucleoside-diphosphate reductase alpha chain
LIPKLDWLPGTDGWRTVDTKIAGADGEVLFEKTVEVPKHWSDTAATVMASKYMRQDEDRAAQVFHRIVDAIGKYGRNHGYFDIEEDKQFRCELFRILYWQVAAFNSPVWFNIGTDGPQQASACYILDVEDSMEGILDLAKKEAMIFKMGSGVGFNISTLRHKGAPLSNGGTSSGPVSFMRGLDSLAGAIKSGGKTRRAARMVIMDANHPDCLEFVWCKAEEEEKARKLGLTGIDADPSIGYQNTNHSVRVTDYFMEQAQETGTKESELFDAIAQAAWECGDPGLQFADTINRDNVCNEEIVSSNACSEFQFINNSACNLASINVGNPFLVDFDARAAEKKLRDVAAIMIIAMDILVDLADYPTEEIAANSHAYRPLGLGITNLGAYLMEHCIAYDSDEGRQEAKRIVAEIAKSAYETSNVLACRLGVTDELRTCANRMEEICDRHARNAKSIDYLIVLNARDTDVPFRNAQLTLMAPAGTISLLMDCESTGIEPVVAPKVTKRLSGGGTIMQEPSCVQRCKELLVDSDDDNQPELATALGENTVSVSGHLKMMRSIQCLIHGAISKTVNLPNSATVEDVKQCYIDAWEYGIKAIAIYRDGCKAAQPLNTDTTDEQENIELPQPQTDRRKKLPPTRNAVTHKFSIGGHEGYVTVGLYEDGSPGEIFVVIAKEGSTISGLMDAFATSVSMSLQYGVPLDVLADKFRYSRFEPMGFTGNPDVPKATSIIDYIFAWMQQRFEAIEPPSKKVCKEIEEQYTAQSDCPTCTKCGAITQRTGRCHTCTNCGETTGCG